VHGKDQNVLLVGLDSRDGLSPAEQHLLKVGSDQSLSTDTIMVLHVPADGRRATMISIPRDSYVDIDGYAKNKINAAYADAYSDAEKKGATHEEAERAGADLLVETVRKLTGLRIDHYVQVGFGGFYTIAKALGSIPVTLCAATDDSFARNRADGQSGGSGFKMSAGRHDLDPVQALKFVRQRHYLHGGDLAREKRQRYFIGAAFDKIATAGVLLDPAKVGALIKAVHGAFYVDSGFDPLSFAKQLVDLSADKITGFTIPTQGEAQVSILGTIQDVVLVDPAKVQGAIADRLNPPPTSTSSSTAPPGPTASPGPPTPSGHSAAPVAKGCVY
jgi:LCP family protein required for cell wall assembly